MLSYFRPQFGSPWIFYSFLSDVLRNFSSNTSLRLSDKRQGERGSGKNSIFKPGMLTRVTGTWTKSTRHFLRLPPVSGRLIIPRLDCIQKTIKPFRLLLLFPCQGVMLCQVLVSLLWKFSNRFGRCRGEWDRRGGDGRAEENRRFLPAEDLDGRAGTIGRRNSRPEWNSQRDRPEQCRRCHVERVKTSALAHSPRRELFREPYGRLSPPPETFFNFFYIFRTSPIQVEELFMISISQRDKYSFSRLPRSLYKFRRITKIEYPILIFYSQDFCFIWELNPLDWFIVVCLDGFISRAGEDFSPSAETKYRKCRIIYIAFKCSATDISLSRSSIPFYINLSHPDANSTAAFHRDSQPFRRKSANRGLNPVTWTEHIRQ